MTQSSLQAHQAAERMRKNLQQENEAAEAFAMAFYMDVSCSG